MPSSGADDRGKIRVQRWGVLKEFNPLSHVQVKQYMRFKGYPIPKDRATHNETSGEDAIRAILTKHPGDQVLPLCLEASHINKGMGYLADTYVGKDGRLHPIFTYLPDTGRLSSVAPNLMNIPQDRGHEVKRRVAKAIRETLIATPGWVFGHLDWRAIEATLLGYLAHDPVFMRLAALGVHSYVMTHYKGQPADLGQSDEELKKIFKRFKDADPTAYHRCKTGVYSGLYGATAWVLAQEMHCTRAEAENFITVFERAAPGWVQWKKDTLQRAHYDGRLTNPFGFSRAFWDVYSIRYKPDGSRVVTLGKEAKKALAHGPQSTGAAMLRIVLLDLAAHPLHGKAFHLIIPTHDSIDMEILEGWEDEVMSIAQRSMERAWPELGGLVIRVEGKLGRTLLEEDMAPWGV